MVTNNIGLGLEYLYTDVKDKDYVVNVGAGTADPATNPFLLNGGGTDIRRSDPTFQTPSVRGSLRYRFCPLWSRSEERRVGKGCVGSCSSRSSALHSNKEHTDILYF